MTPTSILLDNFIFRKKWAIFYCLVKIWSNKVTHQKRPSRFLKQKPMVWKSSLSGKSHHLFLCLVRSSQKLFTAKPFPEIRNETIYLIFQILGTAEKLEASKPEPVKTRAFHNRPRISILSNDMLPRIRRFYNG